MVLLKQKLELSNLAYWILFNLKKMFYWNKLFFGCGLEQVFITWKLVKSLKENYKMHLIFPREEWTIHYIGHDFLLKLGVCRLQNVSNSGRGEGAGQHKVHGPSWGQSHFARPRLIKSTTESMFLWTCQGKKENFLRPRLIKQDPGDLGLKAIWLSS